MGITGMVLALTVLFTVHTAKSQAGLRTAPLAAPRIRHHNENNMKDNKNGSELFSKWPSIDMGHRRGGSGKMESELAAIFRGVAYGLSTLPSTTVIPITTTITTTNAPFPNINKYGNHQKASKDNQSEHRKITLDPFTFPNWRESELPQTEIHSEHTKEPPVQYPYVESPDLPSRSTPSDELDPTNRLTGIQVVRADVTKVEWIQSLGVAWFVHVYTAAGLYSVLALLALFWITRVKADMHLLPTGYFITFHVLMFVAAILRCIHLIHDPYGGEQKLPQPLSKTVEETSWPCLTAAVALVVLAIVRSWQCPRLIPQHNYGPLGLALLTTVHLLMTLTALLTAYLVADQASALNAASQAVTLAWGSTVGVCGLFAIWKVRRDSSKHSGQFSRTVLIVGTNLALVSCLSQICLAVLHLYALVGPHYINDIPPLYPWYWLVYHSSVRLLEILTWVLLCATSALNLGTSRNKRSGSSGETKLLTVLGCQCCGSSTSIATPENVHDMYPGMCHTNRSVRNFSLLNSGKRGHQETIADPLMGSIAQNNFSTFQDTCTDAHLVWNNSSNIPNTTSNPSSMLLNESGFVRFKLNADTSQAVDEVLRKSIQNLDLVSQIHDSKYQSKQWSQNKLNASEYSDDPPPYEKTAASPLSSHKPNISSPQSLSGGNLEQLLQNQINTKLYTCLDRIMDDHSEDASITDVSSTEATSPPPTSDVDWSKYSSTCSTISAANSFDVRMYNDIEVSQYHQNPSSASYHRYASLHRPYNLGNQSQQNNSYRVPNDVAFNNYEPNQSTSQLKALISPKNTVKNQSSPIYTSPTKNTPDIDVRLNSTRHITQFKKSVSLSPGPKRSPYHSLRYGTPDSGLAMDYSGTTDETSGDDINLVLSSANFNPRLCMTNQELKKQQILSQNSKSRTHSTKIVHPCGHYPHGYQHADTATWTQLSPVMKHVDINSRQQPSSSVSPSRPPLYPGSPILQEKQRLQLQYQLQQRIQNEQIKQQCTQRQMEQLTHQRNLEQNQILRSQNCSPSRISVPSSRENVNISNNERHQLQLCASPSLLEPISANGYDSDLPSECVDSQDEVKHDQKTSTEGIYENILEPFTAEAWPPSS